jgi:hypothetical protein
MVGVSELALAVLAVEAVFSSLTVTLWLTVAVRSSERSAL